jgi:hypothetical protein
MTDKRLKPLSATMVFCVDDTHEAGGELVRYQGGYWAARNARRGHNGIPFPYHGSSTVQALVDRNVAEYSEYRDGRNGRFPIAMRLLPEEAKGL